MIHGLLLGGALAVAAGAIPAAAAGVATTRPLSDYSAMQVQTPNGVQAFNPDGYQLRVTEYERAPAAYRGGFGLHSQRVGQAAPAVEQPTE
jgi:hypothetical protein